MVQCECGYPLPTSKRSHGAHRKSVKHDTNLRAIAARETGDTVYQCDFCPAMFFELRKYTRHSNEHNAKDVRPCDVCGSEYDHNNKDLRTSHPTGQYHMNAVAAAAALASLGTAPAPAPGGSATTGLSFSSQQSTSAQGSYKNDVEKAGKKDGESMDEKTGAAQGEQERPTLENPPFDIGTSGKKSYLFPVKSLAQGLLLPPNVLFLGKPPREGEVRNWAWGSRFKKGLSADVHKAHVHKIAAEAQLNHTLYIKLHPIIRQKAFLDGMRAYCKAEELSPDETDKLIFNEILTHDQHVRETDTGRAWKELSTGVRGKVNVFAADDDTVAIPDWLDLEHDDLRAYAIPQTTRHSKLNPDAEPHTAVQTREYQYEARNKRHRLQREAAREQDKDGASSEDEVGDVEGSEAEDGEREAKRRRTLSPSPGFTLDVEQGGRAARSADCIESATRSAADKGEWGAWEDEREPAAREGGGASEQVGSGRSFMETAGIAAALDAPEEVFEWEFEELEGAVLAVEAGATWDAVVETHELEQAGGAAEGGWDVDSAGSPGSPAFGSIFEEEEDDYSSMGDSPTPGLTDPKGKGKERAW